MAGVSFSAPVVNDLSSFKVGSSGNNTPKGGGGLLGFLGRNASTIGGIALPAIADIATGGLAAPADAALSAIGSGAGKAITNSTNHQSLTSGVGQAAGMGAIGSLTGNVLGKGGSLLSKVVTKPIDNGVAKAADNSALQQTLAEQAPFQGIQKSVLQKNDVNGAINGLKTLNMAPTPANMRLASNFATGADGQGTIGLQQALTGQKANVGNYLDHVKQAINEQPLLGSPDARTGVGADLLKSITNNKENNLFGGQGSLTQNADANNVLNGIRYHEGQASRYGASVPGTPGDAIGQVHQAAANYLKGALDTNPAINKAVKDYTMNPSDTAAFTKDVISAGGSPELAQHIVGSINGAKSVPELRSFQAPFVRMGNLSNAADTVANGKLVSPSAAGAKGGFGALPTIYEGASALHGNPIAAGVLASKALNSAPVAAKAGGLLSKIRSVNNSAPGQATVGQEVARTLGQTSSHAGQNQPAAPGDTTAVGANSSSPLSDALASIQSPQSQTSDQTDTSTPFSGGNIQRALAADMAMTGGKHVTELLALYNAFGKSQDALTTNQKNEVTGAQKAQQALTDYAQQLDSVGGGKGLVGGNIENIAGKLGAGGNQAAAAHALESQRTDIATSVASALTPTGKPTANVTKQIADSLPTITDTSAVAKAKLTQLMTRIQNGEFTAQQPIGA